MYDYLKSEGVITVGGGGSYTYTDPRDGKFKFTVKGMDNFIEAMREPKNWKNISELYIEAMMDESFSAPSIKEVDEEDEEDEE